MKKTKVEFIKNDIKQYLFYDAELHQQQDIENLLLKNNIENFSFFFDISKPVLIAENNFLFDGEVGYEITLNTLLPYLKAKNKITINSGGGSLFDGLQIYDFIKKHYPETEIEVLGVCASAATFILLATSNRSMTKNSTLLIHEPFTYAVGNAKELTLISQNLETERQKIAVIYAEVSEKSVEDILNIMSKEKFLNYTESLSLNFVKANINNDNNKNEMSDQTELKNKLSNLEKIIKNVTALFNVPKNLILQDVNGTELNFDNEDITSESDIVIGSTATVNNEPANGSYTLVSETILIFENGAVTEITLKSDDTDTDEVENLKTEIAANNVLITDLKNQITAKDLELLNYSNKEVQFKADIKTVKESFESFKNEFTEDKPIIHVPSSKTVNSPKMEYTSRY